MGVKILREIHRTKNLSGVTIIEKIDWDEHESEKNQLRKRTKPTGKATTKEEKVEPPKPPVVVDERTIHWPIVILSSVTIIFSLFIVFGYMRSYNPMNELILRHRADNMGVASLAVLAIAFFFAVLAFFH